jgi:hypothetical protein
MPFSLIPKICELAITYGPGRKREYGKKDRLSAKRLIDGEFCYELGREVSSNKWAFP